MHAPPPSPSARRVCSCWAAPLSATRLAARPLRGPRCCDGVRARARAGAGGGRERQLPELRQHAVAAAAPAPGVQPPLVRPAAPAGRAARRRPPRRRPAGGCGVLAPCRRDGGWEAGGLARGCSGRSGGLVRRDGAPGAPVPGFPPPRSGRGRGREPWAGSGLRRARPPRGGTAASARRLRPRPGGAAAAEERRPARAQAGEGRGAALRAGRGRQRRRGRGRAGGGGAAGAGRARRAGGHAGGGRRGVRAVRRRARGRAGVRLRPPLLPAVHHRAGAAPNAARPGVHQSPDADCCLLAGQPPMSWPSSG